MNWFHGFEKFVRAGVSLHSMTTYRVGGPAEFFAEPPDTEALGLLLKRAHECNVPVRLLGHGTNLLVADTGVSGLTVRLPKHGFGILRRNKNEIHIGAGHSLPALVKWSVAQGLTGLECLQGVPGTVGAALRMNAGGKYGEICTSVTRVRGLDIDGTEFELRRGDCGFVYRNSGLKGRIVTECDLELYDGHPAHSKKMLDDILHEKCATQPVYARSAGCVFKNPKLPNVPPAGKLIDDAGLKGLRVGGASVSTLHANFLICESGATAADLAELIRAVRQRVHAKSGVMLELEVETWGFTPEELLPAA